MVKRSLQSGLDVLFYNSIRDEISMVMAFTGSTGTSLSRSLSVVNSFALLAAAAALKSCSQWLFV